MDESNESLPGTEQNICVGWASSCELPILNIIISERERGKEIR